MIDQHKEINARIVELSKQSEQLAAQYNFVAGSLAELKNLLANMQNNKVEEPIEPQED